MRYIFTILLLVVSNSFGTLYAQSLFPEGTSFQPIQTDSLPEEKEESEAYYTRCVKVNGWMEGCGRKLTLSEARHHSSYLRFSKMNDAGHWTCVENLTGRGKRENNQFSTYLVNPFDDEDTLALKGWKTKLKSVVLLEFLGDVTGEQCIQERAYDEDGSLVYAFVVTPIDTNKVMGHYIDQYGEPIKLRSSEEASYVIIERDSRGFETAISFVGEEGYYKKNKDGAFMERNTYDDAGNRLSLMSCDVDGSYMIDRVGNCGQRLTYNKFGDNVSVTNLDEKGQVMKPSGKFYVSRSKFDKYGREIECRYYLPSGEPDTIESGVHGCRSIYNDFGDCEKYALFGLDGKPHNGKGGFAVLKRKYDDEGRCVDLELRDADGLLCRDYAGWHDVYEGEELVREDLYKSEKGITKYVYGSYVHGGNIHERRMDDKDDAWRERYDSLGRMIENAYFDAEGRPNMSRGYHMSTYTYTTDGHALTEETRLLDADSMLISAGSYSYNRKVVVFDSLSHLQTTVYYDGDRMLSNYVQRKPDASSDFVASQYSLDITGRIARTWYSDALHYTTSNEQNLKGNTTCISVRNEYGEPAYSLTVDSYSPQGWSYNFWGNSMYADDKNEDGYTQDMMEEVNKACIIEIINDSVDNYGLLSGDVIMKYGDWAYQDLDKNTYPDDELRLETFLKREYPKEMVVMRHNLQKMSPEYHVIQLPKGLPKDFGFVWHYFPYTDKETQRYKDTFAKYRADMQLPDSVFYSGLYVPKGIKMSTMRISHINTFNLVAYKEGIRNDAWVLGCMVIDTVGETYTYLANDTLDKLETILTLDKAQSFKIWYTEDLKSVRSAEFVSNKRNGIYYSVIKVPDSLSSVLIEMAQPVGKAINELIVPDCSAWSEEQKDSLYNLAHELWMKDADNRAFLLFSELGRVGYKKAHYNLFASYFSGYGVEKDMAQAEYWEQLCRQDSTYMATYYIARKYVKENNKKKAKEYMGYLRKGNRDKRYTELMSQYLLQNGDTLKALPYLNDYMYYLYSENDSAAIVNYCKEYDSTYFARYPKRAADGVAHLAFNVYDLGYFNDAIRMFNKARSVKGNIKTEQINYERTYWNLLEYKSQKEPEEYGEMFQSYIEDKCFSIKWKKGDPVAKAMGVKGECVLLAYNGWNLTATDTPFDERKSASDDEKERHITLYYKGRIIHYDYTGADKATIEIKTVSKEERRRMLEMYNRSASATDMAMQ